MVDPGFVRVAGMEIRVRCHWNNWGVMMGCSQQVGTVLSKMLSRDKKKKRKGQ